MTEKQVKVRPALTGMNIGDKLVFPIETTKSVRAQCSDLGLILNRKYKTETSRERRVVEVTRTA